MGLNVKLGKGGHGLEVYDEEGKYAEEFSFEINGQQIKGYDDFRTIYFASLADNSAGQYDAQTLENIYNQDAGFKDEVDNALYPEYNNMVQNAVDEHNAKQVWDTPEEAAKYLHELFVPNLVKNLVENDIVHSSASVVTGSYKVSTFAACLQMSRYNTNRANVVDANEYSKIMSTQKAEGSVDSGSENYVIENYIDKAIKENKCIPILRNLSGISPSNREVVIESFYDENNPRHSCLSHYDKVRCSYLGSVIYFSTGGESYGYSSVSVRGFVKMSDKLKLLKCPLSNWQANEYACNRGIPEINKFRYAIEQDKEFDNRLIERFKKEVPEQEARQIVARFKTEIARDPGLCAILMGYDAIYGISYQFDLLNLGIAHVLKS